MTVQISINQFAPSIASLCRVAGLHLLILTTWRTQFWYRQGEYEIWAHLVPRGKRPVMRAKESQRSQPNLQALDPNALKPTFVTRKICFERENQRVSWRPRKTVLMLWAASPSPSSFCARSSDKSPNQHYCRLVQARTGPNVVHRAVEFAKTGMAGTIKWLSKFVSGWSVYGRPSFSNDNLSIPLWQPVPKIT